MKIILERQPVRQRLPLPKSAPFFARAAETIVGGAIVENRKIQAHVMKVVFLAIASFGNRWDWPSRTAIARRAEVSRKTARRAIIGLEESGRLAVKLSPGRRTNGYFPIVEPCPTDTVEPCPTDTVEPCPTAFQPCPTDTVKEELESSSTCVDARESRAQHHGAAPPGAASPKASTAAPPAAPRPDSRAGSDLPDVLQSYPNMQEAARNATKRKAAGKAKRPSDIQRVPNADETQRYLESLREARRKLQEQRERE